IAQNDFMAEAGRAVSKAKGRIQPEAVAGDAKIQVQRAEEFVPSLAGKTADVSQVGQDCRPELKRVLHGRTSQIAAGLNPGKDVVSALPFARTLSHRFFGTLQKPWRKRPARKLKETTSVRQQGRH